MIASLVTGCLLLRSVESSRGFTAHDLGRGRYVFLVVRARPAHARGPVGHEIVHNRMLSSVH
jgi:hypothetical protein